MGWSCLGGGDRTGVAGSLDGQEIFPMMQSPTAKVQIAAGMMAASYMKAQCGSRLCMWSSLSSESLDGLPVPIQEQIHKLSGPIHGLHSDLDCFGFVCRDHLIHCPNVTSGTD